MVDASRGKAKKHQDFDKNYHENNPMDFHTNIRNKNSYNNLKTCALLADRSGHINSASQIRNEVIRGPSRAAFAVFPRYAWSRRRFGSGRLASLFNCCHSWATTAWTRLGFSDLRYGSGSYRSALY